jgi:hypothetical protein
MRQTAQLVSSVLIRVHPLHPWSRGAATDVRLQPRRRTNQVFDQNKPRSCPKIIAFGATCLANRNNFETNTPCCKFVQQLFRSCFLEVPARQIVVELPKVVSKLIRRYRPNRRNERRVNQLQQNIASTHSCLKLRSAGEEKRLVENSGSEIDP